MHKGLALATLALVPAIAIGQARPPTVNPLETLPRVEKPAPQASVQLTVETRQRNARLEALLATPITPSHVNISGVHALPFAKVASLFKPLVDRHVHIGDLVKAASACSGLYKKAGYALSFCYVPIQDFDHGAVTVVAVEGHVAQVDFEGNGAGNMRRKILQITAPLLQQRPLRTATFERVIQLLGMLPGARIKARVPPPTSTDGATRLLLSVTRKHFNSDYGVDFNHPGIAGILGVSGYGLTPLAERIDAAVMAPHGHVSQHYAALGYSQMLGDHGLTLRLNGSRFSGNPDTDSALPAWLRHRLRQDQLALALGYPLWLDAHHNLSLTGKLYGTDQDDRYLNLDTGAALRIRTRTRALHLGVAYIHAVTHHVSKLDFGVTRGLGIWGAGQTLASNIPGLDLSASTDTRFTRYNFSLSQVDTWRAHIGTILRIAAQYSPDRLPSSEQISFGGPAFASAYDPGSSSGDSGWGASAEVNRAFPQAKPWLKSVTPYLQLQAARAYLHGTRPVIRSLDSCVLGVRFGDGRHYSVDVSAAQPFGDLPLGATHRRPRYDLTFAYQLD